MNYTIKIDSQILSSIKKAVNTTSDAYACKIVILSHLNLTMGEYNYKFTENSNEFKAVGISIASKLKKTLEDYAKYLATPMTMPKLLEYIVTLECMKRSKVWDEYVTKKGGEV